MEGPFRVFLGASVWNLEAPVFVRTGMGLLPRRLLETFLSGLGVGKKGMRYHFSIVRNTEGSQVASEWERVYVLRAIRKGEGGASFGSSGENKAERE